MIQGNQRMTFGIAMAHLSTTIIPNQQTTFANMLNIVMISDTKKFYDQIQS